MRTLAAVGLRKRVAIVSGASLIACALAMLTPVWAAAPMCQGEEATIVGEGTLEGTSGPDVIAATGRAEIWGRGGDDTICAIAGEVHAGYGDDSVEGGGATNYVTLDVNLGPGDDEFVDLGSTQNRVDRVSAIESLGHDVIATGGGSDWVDSGVAGEPNQDEIDLGSGEDMATVMLTAGSHVAFAYDPTEGSAWDLLTISAADSDSAAWDVDLGSGSVERAGVKVMSMSVGPTRFLSLSLSLGDKSQATVIGTPARDAVQVWSGRLAGADLGAGDDYFSINSLLDSSGDLDAGPGDDAVAVISRSIDLNLAKDRLRRLGSKGRGYDVSGVDQWGLSAPRIAIVGDSQSNSFEIGGCWVRMEGGKGKDQLFPGYESGLVDSLSCGKGARWRLYGQGGKDYLSAKMGDDILIGGPGRDRVNGGAGHDRCRAEIEKSCEG